METDKGRKINVREQTFRQTCKEKDTQAHIQTGNPVSEGKCFEQA